MKFTVNNKEYESKPLNLGNVAKLDELGYNIEYIAEHSTSFMIGYFSFCSGLTVEEAADELESEFVELGTIGLSLSEALNKEIEDSRFFHKLLEKATEAKAQKTAEKKSEKKK